MIVLEWFEWVTDEFQTNQVSISRAYPCLTFSGDKLSKASFKHLEEFCELLLQSLDKRFGKLVKNEEN